MVSDDATLSNKQTQELSDGLLNDYLTVTVINDEELLNSEYVAVKSNQGNEQTFDMYRITNVQTNDDATTFTGIQLAYYELAGYVVEDVRPVNRTVSYVASQLLNGTEWRVGYVENNLPNVTDRFYYLSAKDSFTKLQEIANCEVVFKVEISGQGVTDKWVEIYSQLGDRTLKRFNYGSNALTIEREIGKNDIYTALIGRGKGEEIGDGYGRKLTFEDVVWSTANGNPVDKPKGQKYIELPQATAEYGIKTSSGKVPRIGIVEFDETEDVNVLIRETYNALVNVARPKVQFKSTVINIGSTNIGDTVTIHRHDLNIHYETRVYKVVRDKLDNDFTEVTLGDAVTQSSTRKQARFYSTINSLQSNQSELATQVNYIGQTADRKNAINWGNNEPQFKRTGDLWYRDHPSIAGEKQMLIWNGEGWDITLDTSIENSVAEEVEAVWQEMDANKTATEQAINQAVTDANAYAEQQTSALKTEVEASNEILDTAIATAQNRADAAQNRADAAFSDAEIAKNNAFAATQTAQTAINDSLTAVNNAQDALTSAETAISTANTAKSTANTAKSNAGTALTNANAALNRVGAVEETTGELSTSYDNLTKTVALKADQTTVDGIEGTVTNQGTAITANATAIGLKADKSVVDTINGTVAKHTTDIKANSDGLKLKADSTTVNSIKGTVDTHTTQIKAASDGLTLKADKSQVDTIKGTVDKHTLDISANATAVGLKADKSVVDTIKGTVDKHTLDIKAAADGLTLKADSSLVNTIKGTVDTHTTQIGANSTAISARLTSAQVETLLTGKKYVNETKLTATANGLSASITQVSNDLSNLEIGGRNLLRNTNTENWVIWGSAAIETNNDDGYVVIKAISNASTSTTFGIQQAPISRKSEIKTGEIYTLSFMVRGNIPNLRYIYLMNEGSSNQSLPQVRIESETEFKKATITFTANTFADLSSGSYIMISDNGLRTTEDWFEVKQVQLEKGNKATDWTPAPEDMATLEQFTTIDATVKGLQTTVGNKADKSQITQLSGQISSKVESSTYTSKMTQLDSAISSRVTSSTYNSKMTQLDSAIQSKVDSATYSSKMTQLDNAISLRVVQKDVTDAILADKTIKDTRATNQLPSWYFSNYPKQTVEEFKQRTTMGVPGSATYGQLTTKVIWSATSGGVITQIFSSSDGVFQRQGNAAATAWLAWDKVAEAGKLLSQINLSTEGVLIQGKRIQLDGDVSMTTAFVNNIKAKSLEAVYADIVTLKTKVLTTDVITSTMLKSDTALINKIFATDANVNALTAKTAFVNSVKAVNIAADRITSGTLNAANVNIINLNASKIVASSLSALTTNTGALNVTDWLTFSTDNKGIRATYDFGDQLGGSFDPRWFVGSYTLGYRYMKFLADVYTVSSSGGRGNYGYYSESFYGPDYFKLRQYNNSTMARLLTRIDMRSEYISLSTSFDETKIYLNANGDTFFAGNMQVNGDLTLTTTKALKAYYVQAPETAYNLYINGARNDLGSMRFGMDGSTLNGGRLISSDSVYKRTYSSAANVIVFDTGTIGRSVSARKYKLNIESNDLLETALKTLTISPSSWHDKAEVESIAKTMSNGTEQELDPNFRLKKHHGFIADEFHEKGATEVVVYDSKGEVEGLAYDRISMYHHELIKDLYHRIEQQENKIKELERKTT